MQGRMGDYRSQCISANDISAFAPGWIMDPVADQSQPFIAMGTGESIAGYRMRSANYENSEGEWNTVALICFEDKAVHIVNGHIVMILRNFRYLKNGEKIALKNGKIQLQSEGAMVSK